MYKSIIHNRMVANRVGLSTKVIMLILVQKKKKKKILNDVTIRGVCLVCLLDFEISCVLDK